jgi:Tol biopolymer transport system component
MKPSRSNDSVQAGPYEGRLESWKEIASYLNRDVRTVQRWEQTKGLPVRRLPGGEMARVYALRPELDAWWNSRGIHLASEPETELPASVPGKRGRRRVWAVVALGLAGLAALAAWRIALKPAASPPLRVVPLTSFGGEVSYPSFSPDGKQVVFTWNGEKQDNFDLYVKQIEVGEPLRLTRHPAMDSWASWSPDGRHIAFVRWQIGLPVFELRVIPALGGAERLLVECPLPEVWPAPAGSWTPDSRSLILGFPGAQTHTALFLLSVETGERRRLTSPPAGWNGDDSPVLSPDGSRVAFIRRRGPESGNVFLLNLYRDYSAQGEPQQLTHEPCCTVNPLWTGDGRQILYLTSDQDISTLHRIPAHPGGQPETVDTIGALGSQLAISRQGDKLAYVSGQTDSDLWRVDLPRRGSRPAEGSGTALPARRVLSSSRTDAFPDISPDGKRVAFGSNRSGTFEVWIAEADGSGARQVTALGGPPALLPRWSPDGKQIAYYANMDGNRDVYIVSAEGGKPRRLTRDSASNMAPTWSRDGRWIYFASDRTGTYQCWKAPSDGGQAIQLTRGGGYGGFESMDSRYLYYAKVYSSSAVWRVPVSGGEERPVHPEVTVFRVPWNFAVTAAGIYAPATSNPLAGFELRFYSFATGATEILGKVDKPFGRSMSVSPDGRWLLFQDYPAHRGDLMLVENFR